MGILKTSTLLLSLSFWGCAAANDSLDWDVNGEQTLTAVPSGNNTGPQLVMPPVSSDSLPGLSDSVRDFGCIAPGSCVSSVAAFQVGGDGENMEPAGDAVLEQVIGKTSLADWQYRVNTRTVPSPLRSLVDTMQEKNACIGQCRVSITTASNPHTGQTVSVVLVGTSAVAIDQQMK